MGTEVREGVRRLEASFTCVEPQLTASGGT